MTGRNLFVAVLIALAAGAAWTPGARAGLEVGPGGSLAIEGAPAPSGSSEPAQPSEVLLGDANGDGRVTGADFAVFNAVIYDYRRIPLERVRALDLDEDGDADLDDLAQLLMDIRDREPARREVRPAAAPSVVFRDVYNAGLRPLSLERELEELERELSRESAEVSLENLGAFRGFDSTREFIRDFERYRAEAEAAIHYGLLGGAAARRACENIRWEETYTYEEARGTLAEFRSRRPEGRDYVERCERNLRAAPGGTWVPQTRQEGELCWRYGVLPHPFFNTARFTVGLQKDRLTLELPIRFDFGSEYEAHPDRLRRDERRMTKAMRCVQDWWSQYGVRFRFRLADDAEARFSVHEGEGRANSGNLYLGATEGRTDALLCSMLAHETGHRIGLPDEYDEGISGSGVSCGADRVKEDDSLMSQAATRNLWGNRFYPRHLASIFGSICGPYR